YRDGMRFRLPALLLAAVVCTTTAELAAQTAGLTGTVVDTLNRRRLSGAQIFISGVTRTIYTDAAGRFTVDSLAPGEYTVGFRHPALDTLGIRSTNVNVVLTAGAVARVALGIPSGRTFMRLCPVQGGLNSRSAVFGVVRNTSSDEPVRGTQVKAAWGELYLDATLGPRRRIITRDAVTDSTGLYIICDLPPATDVATVTVTGTADGYQIATGDVNLRSEEAVPLHLSMAPEGAAADAILTGRILDNNRRPLANADVWVTTARGQQSAVARTDSSGTFTLTELHPGTAVVAARRIGSSPGQQTVSLASGRSTEITMALPAQAMVLDEVKVEGRAVNRAEQSGFNERRAMGFGRFMDRENLDRMAALVAGDIFRQLPFIRLEEGNSGLTLINQNSRSTSGGAPGCEMALLVNGMLTPAQAMVNLPKEEIDGIEVFNNAERVPMQYASPATTCGAVLLWMRR
ncbi:MAG: MSCRAMM family protein, partial [Gemmatimonadales bacterium]